MNNEEYYSSTQYDENSFSLKHLSQKKAQHKYREKNKKKSRKELPLLEIIKQYSASPDLTPEEKELIESMPGVSWQ